MQKFLLLFFLMLSSHALQVCGNENPTYVADQKNVLATTGNHIVIMRSFVDSFFSKDVNLRTSYLEAYDVRTGEMVWFHKSKGMIVSYIIHNNETIIYRNYQYLTALDLHTGEVLWSQKTLGEYSTLIGSE